MVAAELFERALAAAEQLDHVRPAERARVCEALGDVCERFAAYDRAADAYARAQATLPGDRLFDTRMVAKTGVLHERSGRYDEALEAYAGGLSDLAGLDGPAAADLRAQIAIGQAGIHYRQARYQDSIAAALEAIAQAEVAGAPARVAHARYILDAAYTDLGTADGLPYLERALPIYEELRDFRGQGIVLDNLGVHASYERRWSEALSHYRQSREAKERVGDAIGAAVQMNNEAEILSDQGRLDDAPSARPGDPRRHPISRRACAPGARPGRRVRGGADARALAAVGGDDRLRAESDAVLERLGVVSVPRVPLP